MSVKSTFKLSNETIPMELGYYTAHEILPPLGLDILSIFEDSAGNPIATIMVNDRTMLKVWYHFVNEHNGIDFKEALHELDETKGGLEDFKKAFLDLVIAFFGPSARGGLEAIREEVTRQLKKKSNFTSLASSEETQDS